MKKSLSVLIPILMLGALPVLAQASGDHAGGHDMQGMQGMHDMSQMSHDMKGMEGMEGMSHEGHGGGAAGQPGDPAKVSRTVDVGMDDTMRFNPDRIEVKAGETVRFFVKNNGKAAHEMVIGTQDELKEHAEMMRSMPNMQHAEPNMIRLAPGQRGGIAWQFDKPGAVSFACLMPGHMEAGMVGKIVAE
ncbi:MAG: cupredoxin family protein [Gammaproteobacteria bacterium]|nr:cupredoxin family protein [Gammaproteobacteria bacterium]